MNGYKFWNNLNLNNSTASKFKGGTTISLIPIKSENNKMYISSIILSLIKENPNDSDLGRKIRKLYGNTK